MSRPRELARVGPWLLGLLFCVVAGCSGSSGTTSTNHEKGPVGGQSNLGGSDSIAEGGESSTESRFLFVDSGTITHEQDYFPLQYANPSLVPATVPNNWLSPIDYSKGRMHMTLDVLEVPEGANAEFYYSVTMTQTDADYDQGWLRPAIHVVPGQSHYEESWPLGETQFVWNDGTEHTSTAAEKWDFSRPFDHVAGDLIAWPNASFPIRVKVRIEVSLP